MSGMDEILKNHFDRFMRRGELPPEIKDHHHTQDLKLFDDEETLKIWRNFRKGVAWTDKEGNILRGAVDNILVKGKKLIVLDYKTRGYALKKNTAEYSQNQLNIYNLLLRNNGFETEDYAFLLFYIPKEVLETGEFVFDAVLTRRNTNIRNAERLWAEALELLNGECPYERCEWCEKV